MDTPAAFAALYRDSVLDHGRAPRHVGELDAPARRAQAYNPLCGDRVALSLRLDEAGRVNALRHRTEGCLICTASASLLAERAHGRDRDALAADFAQLRAALEGGDVDPALGGIAALAGVAGYPSRWRCALLPWEALRTALGGGDMEEPPA